jgi:hypothetical protein
MTDIVECPIATSRAAHCGEYRQAAEAVTDGSARGKRLPAARVVGNTDMICIHHF